MPEIYLIKQMNGAKLVVSTIQIYKFAIVRNIYGAQLVIGTIEID